jgi:6-phosphogluconolactonase
MLTTSVLAFSAADDAPAADARAYVGTYTGGKSEGIYTFTLDLESGKAGAPTLAAKAKNPSFLALHPNGRFLYAVTESNDFRGEKAGAIGAFAVNAETGALTLLNEESSKGPGPCHLVTDKAGKFVLVANYGGGSVCVLPIKADGTLGPASTFIQHAGSSVNPGRQEAPHAHSINLDAANRFAVVADLGLDQVLVYRFDSQTGQLTPGSPPFTKVAPGAGPRHFAFHPNGKFGYVINELALTVTAFDYNADRGTFTELQTIPTVPAPGPGMSTAEVVAHPTGKFLYGSNRGHDSIAMYKVDPATGKLTSLGQEPTRGKTPRNFAIDPSGKFLLAENQGSDTIVLFRIDPEAGTLHATGEVINVPSPVCVRWAK